MESAGNIIKKLLIDENMNQSILANKLNVSSQNLNNKLRRGNFDTTDFFNMLDVLGYEIKVIKKSENN